MTPCRYTLPALAFFGLAACDSGANVSLLLTASNQASEARPGPSAQTLTTAVVTVDRIYLQAEETTDADSDARVVLREDAFTTDLRKLSDATQDLLRDVPVEPRVYAQLRFVISGAYVVVSDDNGPGRLLSTPDYAEVPPGAQVDGRLRTPSWNTSGFKVKPPQGEQGFDFTEGDRVLSIVFDVGDSFGHPTGNGDWIFRPVLRATRVVILPVRPRVSDLDLELPVAR